MTTDPMNLRILSLGAGVQSTTLAMMMSAGDIEPCDRAIFADTKSEPAAVYRHLDKLLPMLPFPVDIVSAGDLGAEILATSRGVARNDARPPFFIKNQNGSAGMLRRQCTGDYKIDVIRKQVRVLLGVPKGHRVPSQKHVVQVIGISFDERGRMKESRDAWQTNEYPLVDRGINRWDCIRMLWDRWKIVAPKSACTFCPYRTDSEWREMKASAPTDFEIACVIDEAIRSPGYGRLVGEGYVHRSMTPLRDVDLSTAEDHGQLRLDWAINECSGMCGV